jgi:hypothetical protein
MAPFSAPGRLREAKGLKSKTMGGTRLFRLLRLLRIRGSARECVGWGIRSP